MHPGFHKTGTTFLQYKVFNQELVFHRLGNHVEAAEIFESPSDLSYSASSALDQLSDLCSFSSDKPNILSSETLCGNPFFGSREAKTIANRLHLTFGEVKILFTVREQTAAARSLYKQYVKMGGLSSSKKFFDAKSTSQFHRFNWETLNYGLLVDHYAKLFGHERILVLTQEQLKKSPVEFYKSLGRFSGANLDGINFESEPYAPSPSMMQLQAFRLSNLFMELPINPDLKIGPEVFGSVIRKAARFLLPNNDRRPDKLDNIIADRIGDRFATGNQILQKYSPADLSQLGYLFP
ncbi:MAG: sulfotransferase domain-containing protein [Sphingorhabdus sp.]